MIRIKTADLLYHAEILAEAKALCKKITFEKDEVAFDPHAAQLVPLVILLSNANVSYAANFSTEEKVELQGVGEEVGS